MRGVGGRLVTKVKEWQRVYVQTQEEQSLPRMPQAYRNWSERERGPELRHGQRSVRSCDVWRRLEGRKKTSECRTHVYERGGPRMDELKRAGGARRESATRRSPRVCFFQCGYSRLTEMGVDLSSISPRKSESTDGGRSIDMSCKMKRLNGGGGRAKKADNQVGFFSLTKIRYARRGRERKREREARGLIDEWRRTRQDSESRLSAWSVPRDPRRRASEDGGGKGKRRDVDSSPNVDCDHDAWSVDCRERTEKRGQRVRRTYTCCS